MKHQLVVIGGGAAGFFCAVNAARLNASLKVLLVEKTGRLLSKVKVSGGGRCNVTNACNDIMEMSRQYPRGANFVKKTFHQFFTTDTIQWFEERGVELKKEDDGRMFPVSDSSQTIIDCLLKEANKHKVDIMLNAEIKELQKINDEFVLTLADGRKLNADYVCIACGGFPKLSMFDWLKPTGHFIEPPVPSLFTFNIPGHPITKLMGVSAENARIKIVGGKLEMGGPLLITHWGLSGPAVLRLSAWGARQLAETNYTFTILINWAPGFNEQSLKEYLQRLRFDIASQKIVNRNPFHLPQRLWEYLLSVAEIKPETRWADLPGKEQNKLIKTLCSHELHVKGKTTFKEEFVTAGGIRLNEIDVNTMESKLVKNLFFAGEIMDVDGITGGFNFQHAWTSGFIAAKSISGGNE
jgi:predicted Rossmann fold flavoprotein